MFAPFCDSKTSVRINASVAFKNIDATLDGIAFEVKTDAATDSGGATGTTDSFFVRGKVEPPMPAEPPKASAGTEQKSKTLEFLTFKCSVSDVLLF